MGKTTISWTEHTINPIRARNKATGQVGHFCEKISPGCANCYASEWNEKRYGTKVPFIPGRADEVELFLDHSKLFEVMRRQKPTTYFVCDMTDLLLAQHPDEWIDKVFATAALCHWHTFQILTKRPERMRDHLLEIQNDDKDTNRWAIAAGELLGTDGCPSWRKDYKLGDWDWPLPNVWLGVSVENQQYADERIPLLLQTPAAVRFLSVEPILGPVDLEPYVKAFALGHDGGTSEVWGANSWRRDGIGTPLLHWVIVGGESGPNRRPCEVEWIADIARQCSQAGVACHVKQDAGPRPGMQGRLPLELWERKEMPSAN